MPLDILLSLLSTFLWLHRLSLHVQSPLISLIAPEAIRSLDDSLDMRLDPCAILLHVQDTYLTAVVPYLALPDQNRQHTTADNPRLVISSIKPTQLTRT